MRLDPQRYEVVGDEMAAVLRALTPDQRLRTAEGLWQLARNLIRDKLRHDYPEWSDQQVDAETARRMAEPVSQWPVPSPKLCLEQVI